MRGWIPVELFLPAFDLQLLDDSGTNQKIQISIDRTQGDVRKSFSDHMIDFIGGRVSGYFLKFLQNDRPLIGETDLSFNVQTFLTQDITSELIFK